MKNKGISSDVTIFHDRRPPEPGLMVGYGALFSFYDLQVPLPAKLSIISRKHKRYETEEWRIFTPRHTPKENLAAHLTFALKYEGIDLHVLKSIFCCVKKNDIESIIRHEPTGQYSRRIWFLYEWMMEQKLDIPDLKMGNFVALVNPKLQYAGPFENSKRHRIKNNLPGVKAFCPMIWRTKTLEAYIKEDLFQKAAIYLNWTFDAGKKIIFATLK